MLNYLQLKSHLIDIIPVSLVVLTIIKQHDRKIIIHSDIHGLVLSICLYIYIYIYIDVHLSSSSSSIDYYYYFFFVPKIMMCMSTSKNQKKYVTSTRIFWLKVRNRNNRGTVSHQSLIWPSPIYVYILEKRIDIQLFYCRACIRLIRKEIPDIIL